MEITKLGGSTIMLPAAAAIAVWLLAGQAPRLAWRWCVLFGGGLILVAVSKVAYAGWGIGISALDFTGFSGHAMRSAAIVPLLCYLPVQWRASAIRYSVVCLGMCLAVLISMSRVFLHFHSVSEAVSGSLLGAAISLCFIGGAENLPKPVLNRALVVGSFVLLFAASFVKPVPTQRLIGYVAELLSGHPVSLDDKQRSGVGVLR